MMKTLQTKVRSGKVICSVLAVVWFLLWTTVLMPTISCSLGQSYDERWSDAPRDCSPDTTSEWLAYIVINWLGGCMIAVVTGLIGVGIYWGLGDWFNWLQE